MVNNLYLCSLVTREVEGKIRVQGLYLVNETCRLMEYSGNRAGIAQGIQSMIFLDYNNFRVMQTNKGMINGIQYKLVGIEVELDHQNKCFSGVYLKRNDATSPRINCIGKYPELEFSKFQILYQSRGKVGNSLKVDTDRVNILYRIQYDNGVELLRVCNASAQAGIYKLEDLQKKYKSENRKLDFSNMIYDKNGVLRNYQGTEIEVKTQDSEEGKLFATKAGIVEEKSKTRIRDVSPAGQSGSAVRKKDNGVTEITYFNDNDIPDKIYDNAREKLAVVETQMAKLNKYYYVLLSTFPKKLTTQISTMGVTVDTMYINPDFVLKSEIGFLTFVLLHEAMHIVFGHVIQGKNKHPKMHNIATDMHINEILSRDFHVPIGGGVYTLFPKKTTNSDGAVSISDIVAEKGKKKGGIQFEIPDTCIYAKPFFNIEQLDVEKVTSMQIYNNLMKKEATLKVDTVDDVNDWLNKIKEKEPKEPGGGGDGQPIDLEAEIKKAVGQILAGTRQIDKSLSDRVNKTKVQISQSDKIIDAALKKIDACIKNTDADGIGAGLAEIQSALGGMSVTIPQMSNLIMKLENGTKSEDDILRETFSQMEEGYQNARAGFEKLRDLLNAEYTKGDPKDNPPGGGDGGGGNGQPQNNKDKQDGKDGKPQDKSDGEPDDNKPQDGGSGGGSGSQTNKDNKEGSTNGGNEQGNSDTSNTTSKGSLGGVVDENGNEITEEGLRKSAEQSQKMGKFGDDTARITYDGKTIDVNVFDDLMTDGLGSTRQRHRRVLDTFQMKVDKTFGKGGASGIGKGAACIERYIKFAKTNEIDWRSLLRNWMSDSDNKTYSYARPNTKSLGMGMVRPGAVRNTKRNVLKDILIMVDVSGSVGEEDLGKIFTQIDSILRKVDKKQFRAQMVYWDDGITNVGEFENLRTMLKIKPVGCGGTNIKKAFEYAAGERSFQDSNGKVWSVKPSQVRGIIIFTDGAVDKDYGEYAIQFKSKTLWVIDGGSYSPYIDNILFGHVALPDPNNK